MDTRITDIRTGIVGGIAVPTFMFITTRMSAITTAFPITVIATVTTGHHATAAPCGGLINALRALVLVPTRARMRGQAATEMPVPTQVRTGRAAMRLIHQLETLLDTFGAVMNRKFDFVIANQWHQLPSRLTV